MKSSVGLMRQCQKYVPSDGRCAEAELFSFQTGTLFCDIFRIQ